MLKSKQEIYVCGIWNMECHDKEVKQMPKVSIIMGVYNCKNKKLLKKSIESIIDQTFSDWEFLICNDGSTDNTLNELRKLQLLDKRIRVISYQQNHGLSHALNILIREATGQYIARQDDDDYSYKDRLQKQVDFLDSHPEYAVVGTIADVFDLHGIWGEYKVVEKPIKETFYWNSPFIHPTVMMQKWAVSNGGYREAEETRRCEDYDLFMDLYAKGYKGYNIQEKLYCYQIVNSPKIKYRPMKYRLDEAKVRLIGFKKMGILKKGFPYVFKPILIGLIPQQIIYKIKKNNIKIL